MTKTITIEFTTEDLDEIMTNYYGLDEDEFDIDDFSDAEIKLALLFN